MDNVREQLAELFAEMFFDGYPGRSHEYADRAITAVLRADWIPPHRDQADAVTHLLRDLANAPEGASDG